MNDELKNQIQKLADAGDTKGLQQLFFDRFSEFDPEDQEALLFGSFLDAVDQLSAEDDIGRFQKEGVEKLYQLEAVRDVLEMQIRAREAEGGGSAA